MPKMSLIIDKRSKIYNLKQRPITFTKSDLSEKKEKNIKLILDKLFSLGIQSVLVEGGAKTITEFLNSGIFDEIHVYIAPKFFGEGISIYQGERSINNALDLKLANVEKLSNDIKITYKRVN